MSKKRVQFEIEEENEDEPTGDGEEKVQESKLPFNKKFKHTLDSDESDDELENEKKYEFNQQEIFDGEEEGNLHRDGEITITPFNIKDELKEGHFDNEGMYIFRKDNDEIKDNWIDNIDWAKIKEVDDTAKSKSSEGDAQETKVDTEECLSKLIELVNPNETVQKAIQRLGKSKLKKNVNRNKNRQRMKQLDQGTSESKEDEEEKERKEKLNTLLELSNQLLSSGDLNIFETKHETLKYQLEETQKQKASEMDMFAD